MEYIGILIVEAAFASVAFGVVHFYKKPFLSFWSTLWNREKNKTIRNIYKKSFVKSMRFLYSLPFVDCFMCFIGWISIFIFVLLGLFWMIGFVFIPVFFLAPFAAWGIGITMSMMVGLWRP